MTNATETHSALKVRDINFNDVISFSMGVIKKCQIMPELWK